MTKLVKKGASLEISTPSTPDTVAPRDTPPDTPAPQRSILIDVVRGLAITLVCLGHTNQGILRRGWWNGSPTGLRLDGAIYAFHMPAFFFVSGIFLRQSLAKRGEKLFVLEKLRTMIYPYVLWACIYAISAWVFARFMSGVPPTWGTFLYNLLTGNTSWFLPTIFFAMMLGVVTRRVPDPLLFVLAVAASLVPFPTSILFVRLGVLHFPYLVAGMWVGMSYTRLERVPVAVAGAVAAVIFALFVLAGDGHIQFNKFWILPAAALGTVMLLMVARCLGHSGVARAFAWIGAASFGIFLLSSFPQGAGRELVLRLLHTTSPLPHLIFPTLLAVLLPAWLYHRRIRLHINWMFVWPF